MTKPPKRATGFEKPLSAPFRGRATGSMTEQAKKLLRVLEDTELNAIADARRNEPVIRVELDDL